MSLSRNILIFLLIAIVGPVVGQTSVYLRNNTWNTFTISVQQYGTHTLNSSQWTLLESNHKHWKADTKIFTTDRDSAAIPQGDTVYFDLLLATPNDSLTLKLRLIGTTGGSELAYTVDGRDFSDTWHDDGNFHQVSTTLAGKNVVIKYKPDNSDSGFSRDIRYVIHDLPIYEIDAADFANPNVLNIMCYNIQMLPFGITGLPEAAMRADLLPAQISPYQDVVVFEEAFDTDPREQHLEPAMLAAGFPYKTTILNDPGAVTIPWNGGVIIFSRWPIEFSDEYDFQLCGQAASDCLANKGIKYARINKMGRKYHIFGTHMDAGSQADDIAAKRSQMAEMREFIAAQNIPDNEGVVYGGDFNVSPRGGNSVFLSMLDSLSPLIPYHLGYNESNFSEDFGNIIDNIWACPNHLIPVEATNTVTTMRSIEDGMWELSDFSDHRVALGRFVYPGLTVKGDTMLCPGDSMTLSVTPVPSATYQWLKDGQAVAGANGTEYHLSGASNSDAGTYKCRISYEVIYGNTTDSVTQLFFPYGPDTFAVERTFEYGMIEVNEAACATSVEDLNRDISIFPNPSNGVFTVNLETSSNGALLTIYSTLGATVFSQPLTTGSNQVLLPPVIKQGLYLVSISQENKRETIQKLIIH